MRFACGIEYDGSAYYGWQTQKQNQLPTIQTTLAQAISTVANHAVIPIAAGRTDTGVHATEQVIHFDTTANRTEHAWLMGINSNLPAEIAVRWLKPVMPEFHARFSAVARRYQYIINNTRLRHPLLAKRVTLIYEPLDMAAMQQAANYLIGEHDFNAFRASSCQAKSPRRCIEFIDITAHKELIITTIQANAFLHHMVRNIMGVLVAIGAGKYPIAWMAEVLASADRRSAGMTLSAVGLYLVKVLYPAHFGID